MNTNPVYVQVYGSVLRAAVERRLGELETRLIRDTNLRKANRVINTMPLPNWHGELAKWQETFPGIQDGQTYWIAVPDAISLGLIGNKEDQPNV